MLTQELRDDKRLADVRSPVQHHTWHPLALWRLQESLEPSKCFGGARVIDPAISLQYSYALIVAERRHLASDWVEVRVLVRCGHHQISTGKGSTGLL